jgi:hypothetical protein
MQQRRKIGLAAYDAAKAGKPLLPDRSSLQPKKPGDALARAPAMSRRLSVWAANKAE